MTEKTPGAPADSPQSVRPQRRKPAKTLLAEVGGGSDPPADPNGPAGPSEPAELGRPAGAAGSVPSRTPSKGPTGPSDSADDIGLASANGPAEP